MMIHIKPRSCSRSDAQLHCEHKVMRAIIGKNGVTKDKQEGDHATPIGIFSLRQVFYRADRIQKPDTVLPVEVLTIRDGWCDDPTHSAYNQKISLPHSARHETLWREDNVYDLIVVIGYNDEKIQPGQGSAIFMHLQRENKAPTEGCVALTEEDLRAVLASGATAIHVHASDD